MTVSVAMRAAIAALLPALGFAAVDWTQWYQCPASGRRLQEEETKFDDVRPAGNALPDYNRYEAMHQIMTINASDGKLLIKGKSAVWSELKELEKPVKIILLFGKPRTGKSTVASMLGCEMAGNGALLFPAYPDEGIKGRKYTEGIWASKPFSFTTQDSIGNPTTSMYMIMDMQSLDRASKFQNKLSKVMTEDALYKLLALMSEVASAFLYMVGGDSMTKGDFETIGLALQNTRRNMVLRSAYNQKDVPLVDKELDMKAHNDPAMIFVPTYSQDQDKLTLPSSFEVNAARFEEESQKAWKSVCDEKDGACTDAFGTLLKENFIDFDHTGGKYPFVFDPLPQVSEDALKDDANFNWAKTLPYKYEEGDACRLYERMYSTRWNCSDVGPPRPSSPSMYRLLIQNMAQHVAKQAPVRVVSWKGQEPLELTGHRMKEVIEVGIQEMNSIGPLPQTELWRKIMQDRCRGEIREWLDFTYGEKKGKYFDKEADGRLSQVNTGLDKLRSGAIGGTDEMANEWRKYEKIWRAQPSMQDAVEPWFDDKPLLQSVMPTCLKSAAIHIELLDQTWDTAVEEWNNIHEIARRQDVERDLRQVQDDLKKVKSDSWWDKFRLYVILGSVVGLVLCVFLMRMWAQCNTTFRACCACCGDWGDTESVTRIVVTKTPSGRLIQGEAQHTSEKPRFATAAVAGAQAKDLQRRVTTGEVH